MRVGDVKMFCSRLRANELWRHNDKPRAKVNKCATRGFRLTNNVSLMSVDF